MNVITAYATLSKLIKTLTGVVTDFSYDSANKAIKLTTTTGTYSIPTSQIIVSSVKGDPGQDGKSAYEIAVDHGYSGTEEDWIKNLGSSFDDSALQAAINKNKTDISNLSADLTNSQSTISQNASNISKNKTDITNIKSDLSDAVSDIATNKSDISNLKTNINKIGDLATLQTTDKTSIINAINELNSKFMQSMTYANKKLTITYKNGLTFDIDLSSIITDTNIGELSNVNDTGIVDKQTLIFDAASNKYIPGTIDTSQTLKDAKDYTDKQIAAISHADAIQCDEKPSLSGDTVTYKKGGATETTTNLDTWFYYQDAEGNWQQTIFIDSVEVTIAMTGVDLTDYVSKSKDVVSTYTGTEVDKNKVVDIAALDALKALINTDLSKKVNTTDIVDSLTSNATDKPLSANQGSVIKTELDKKANTTDINTELAKKINTADIVDNLTSTDTNKPLSANQGKALKAETDKKINKTDIINNLTSTNTDKPLSANQGKVINGELSKKVNITDIVDNLNSTDTNKPLSANQGKVLKGKVDLKANNSDLTNHTSDKNIHITTAERTKWNGVDNKVNKTDLDNLKQGILVTETSSMNKNILLWDVGHYYFNSNAAWRTYEHIPNTDYAPHVYVTSVKPVKYENTNNEGTWFRQIKVDDHLGNSFIRTIYTTKIDDVVNLENGKLISSGSDTGWQRVCTTSVADVPKTIITNNLASTKVSLSSSDSYATYYVKNGTCYVTIWSMTILAVCSVETIFNNLPKSEIGVTCPLCNGEESFAQVFISPNSKVIAFNASATTINKNGYCSFSYPVSE